MREDPCGSAWEFSSVHGFWVYLSVRECESELVTMSVCMCVFDFVGVYMWQCACVSMCVFWCIYRWVWAVLGVWMYLSVRVCIIVRDCECKFSGCEVVNVWVCPSVCLWCESVWCWVCVQACCFMCVCGCMTVWKCRHAIDYECGSVLNTRECVWVPVSGIL